jgi:glycosyltransferase involved in cell wall biosynthesis
MTGPGGWQPGDRIAVAVPTRDRPAHLAVLLAALATQTYPNWTLVVAARGRC